MLGHARKNAGYFDGLMGISAGQLHTRMVGTQERLIMKSTLSRAKRKTDSPLGKSAQLSRQRLPSTMSSGPKEMQGVLG